MSATATTPPAVPPAAPAAAPIVPTPTVTAPTTVQPAAPRRVHPTPAVPTGATPPPATPRVAPVVPPAPTPPPAGFWQKVGDAAKENQGSVAKASLVIILFLFILVWVTVTVTPATRNAIEATELTELRKKEKDSEAAIATAKAELAAATAAANEVASVKAANEELRKQLASKPVPVAIDPSVAKLREELEEVKRAALVRGDNTPRASAPAETQPAPPSSGGRAGVKPPSNKGQALWQGLTGEGSKKAIVSRGSGRVFFEGQHPADGMLYTEVIKEAVAAGYVNPRLNDPQLHEELMRRYSGTR